MRYADGRWEPDRWERNIGRSFLVSVESQGPGNNLNTLNDVAAQLWNPSSTRSLWVGEVHAARAAAGTAGSGVFLARSTARGATPGTTVTPDLDSGTEQEITPETGAVLEGSQFATEPTLATPQLAAIGRWALVPNNAQAVTWLFPEGLRVPPGTGLCVVFEPVGSATARVACTFRFWE